MEAKLTRLTFTPELVIILQMSLTDYCLEEECSFIENGYNTCGFDKFQCNPVREGRV